MCPDSTSFSEVSRDCIHLIGLYLNCSDLLKWVYVERLEIFITLPVIGSFLKYLSLVPQYCCCFNPPTALGSNHCDGSSNEGVENTGKMSSKWVLEVQNTVNGSVKEVNYI